MKVHTVFLQINTLGAELQFMNPKNVITESKFWQTEEILLP